MFYVTVNVNEPIKVNKGIVMQKGLTNNFPSVLFELHDNCKYYDLGENSVIHAAVTNTDLKTKPFSGSIEIVNPHRGQIKLTPVAEDFTMTGVNTLTVKCVVDNVTISFQTTVFVQDIGELVCDILN